MAQKLEHPKDLKSRIKYMHKRWKILWVLAIVALLLILMGVFVNPENFAIWVIGAFFEVSVPFAFYSYFEHKRVESIEEHFPDFLRDIAEFKRSGVTLSQAVQNASTNDYGQLSPEVKKVALELSWGISFEDSMDRLIHRVESQMLDRSISIITAAQAAGGEVTTILETVSSDLRKLKELEAERKSKLSVYTMTIYAIYLLLLFIIVVLTESLVPAIPKMQVAGEFLGGGTSGTITEFEFRELLFQVTLLEAFFAGLISGEMGEGKLSAGIKHSIVLVLISLLAFQLVPPQTLVEKVSETVIDIPATSGTSSRSIEGLAQMDASFSTQDVADQVKLFAKERNRNAYKSFDAKEIKFVPLVCTPCANGKLKIESDKVTIYQTTMMHYGVKYNGQMYEVDFSDPPA